MDNELKIENMEDGKVATVKHKGSFEELNLIYKKIDKWIKKNNLKVTGNYYGRFDSKQDLSLNNIFFELGVHVKDKTKVENQVRIIGVLNVKLYLHYIKDLILIYIPFIGS